MNRVWWRAALLLSLWVPAAHAEPIVIALNEVFQGDITDPAVDDEYSVEVLPGQVVLIQYLASNNKNKLNFWFTDVYGRVLLSNNASLDSRGPVALMGGAYTLRVSSEAGGLGTYELKLVDVQHHAEFIAVGDTIGSALEMPGQRRSYDFDASAGQRVYVDVLTTSNSSGLNWQLTGPLGETVQARTTSLVDGGTFPLLPGTHTLTVLGENAAVGTFEIALKSVAAPAELTAELDQDIEGEIESAGSAVSYALSLDAATRVFFDVLTTSNSGGINWRLLDPGGAVRYFNWGSSLGDHGPFALEAGDWRLELRGESAATGTYTLRLNSVVDTSDEPAWDEPIAGELTHAGQRHTHAIVVPAGRYVVDLLSSSNANGLNRTIRDEHGRVIVNQTTNIGDTGPHALAGGTYYFEVRGESASTGSWEIALVPVVDGQSAVSLGDTVTGAIALGQRQSYTFSADPGQVLTVSLVESSNTSGLNYELQDALGRTVLSPGNDINTKADIALVGGQYTLTVLPEAYNIGTYSFTLTDAGLATWAPGPAAPLGLEADTSGSIGVAGEEDLFALTLATDTRVYFDVLAGANNLYWTLTDPAGRDVFGKSEIQYSSNDKGPYHLAAGTYTLAITHASAAADYSFRVNTWAPQSGVGALDQAIAGTMTQPGEFHTYTVDVPPGGARVYADLVKGADKLYWTLEDPAGQAVFGSTEAQYNTSDHGPWELPEGTYTLRLDPSGSVVPTYEVWLRTVTDTTSGLAIGENVTGSTPSIGGTHTYTFELAQAQTVYADVVNGTNHLYWTLTDDSGATYFDREAQYTADDPGRLLLPAGNYTLVMDASNHVMATWDVKFWSVGFDPPSPLLPDETASQTFATPGDRHTWDLVVSEPIGLYFDVTQAASGVYWTIRNPAGQVLVDNVHINAATDDYGPVMAAAGTYTIDVRAAGGVTPEYGFVVWGVANGVGEELVPGAIVQDELLSPGATYSYPITVSEGQTVNFDIVADSSSSLDWSLIDSTGTAVFQKANAYSWSSHDQVHTLKGGVYTLVYDAVGDDMPFWILRIKDDAEANPLPQGCAACEALDMVFIFDTSGSMSGAAQNLCELSEALVAGLAQKGIPVKAKFWGISNDALIPCVTDIVTEQLGDVIPGSPSEALSTLFCDNSQTYESWAGGAAIVAGEYGWAPNAVRLVVPVGDEGPWCGNPVDALDIDSVQHAISVAKNNQVVLSPIVPDYVGDPVEVQAFLMAQGTNGVRTIATFADGELLNTVELVASAACDTQADNAAKPTLTQVNPPPGTPLEPGTAVTISGQTAPVNHLRPLVDVLIDGQSADAIDATGRFFKTVLIKEGLNAVVIELVEGCGSFVHEVAYPGGVGSESGEDNYADVTPSLSAEYRRTSYDRTLARHYVDARPVNAGDFPVDGPLLMVIGTQLDPEIDVGNADGKLEDGRPYFTVMEAGQTLNADAVAEWRRLHFLNAKARHVRYEVQWLASKNEPPQFQTAPVVSVVEGGVYAYAPQTYDPDGHALAYSLPVGPTGMSFNADTGALTWSAPDALGLYAVSLVVSDGRGGTAVQSFHIEVVSLVANLPPLFVSVPKTSSPVGAAYSYLAQATDADGDTLLFDLLQGPVGLVIDAQTGLLSWDFGLPGNFAVLIEAADPDGAKATQGFTLTVGDTPTNPHSPVITSAPGVLAPIDLIYLYQVVASDPDGDPLVFTLEQAPGGMNINPTTGRVTWVPNETQLGPHAVTVQVDDGFFGVTSQSYSVTVVLESPNLPPYFLTAPATKGVVGNTYTYAAEAVDPEAGDLAWSLHSGPAGLSQVAGLVTWTPAADQAGVSTVALKVTDAAGAVANQVWLLDIRATNAAPEFVTQAPSASLFVGQSWAVDTKAVDADGDTVSYWLVGAPAGMNVDPANGVISFVPTADHVGEVAATLLAGDAYGGQSAQPVSITVDIDLEPPVVALKPCCALACKDKQYQICVGASDAVGLQSTTLTLDGVPAGLDAVGCAIFELPTVGYVDFVGLSTDTSGNLGQDQLAVEVVDCEADPKPVVTLAAPVAGSSIEAPTPLVVSISDNKPEFLTWEVRMKRSGDAAFKVIQTGSGDVADNAVVVIDTTVLANDSYVLQIEADDGIQTGGIEFPLNVVGDLKLGNFSMSFTDMAVPVAGIPLSVTRTYDSLDTRAGDFGAGWRLSLSARVDDNEKDQVSKDLIGMLTTEPFSELTRVYVTAPDGKRHTFAFAPESNGYPTFLTAKVKFKYEGKGRKPKLEVKGQQTVFNLGGHFYDFVIPYNPDEYIFTTADGVAYHVSEQSGLSLVEDVQGNTLEVTPTGIVSSTGVEMVFERDEAGRILSISEPVDPELPGETPGKVSYTYDAVGNLVSFNDQVNNETSYLYEHPAFVHYVTRVEDPLGRPVMRTVFDEDGRVIATCGPDGDLVTLEGCRSMSHLPLEGSSTFVDARGFKSELFYDASGNVVVERRYLDDGVSFVEAVRSYDADGNVLTETTADAHTWTYGYDAAGNRTSIGDPAGNVWTETYNPDCDRPVESCDASGNCWTYEQDAQCNATKVVDPLGQASQTVLNAKGQVATQVDEVGNSWAYAYSTLGKKVKITDPSGNVETRKYNGAGDVVEKVNRLGQKMTWTYDAAHRPLTETWHTEPVHVTTFTWNAAGELTQVVSPDATLELEYTNTGLMKAVTHSGPSAPEWTVSYTYDAVGHVTAVSDSLGGVTTYAYDALGQLAEVKQNGEAVNPKAVELDYSEGGLLSELRRYGGDGTQLAGSTVLETDCGGCATRVTGLVHKDAAGEVLSAIQLVRDASGVVTELTDAEGTHSFVHDGRRALLSADHPGGAQPDEAYQYDGAGNRQTSVSAAYVYAYEVGGSGNQLLDDGTWTYQYDAAGRVSARTHIASGNVWNFDYDFKGRLVQAVQTESSGTVLDTIQHTYTHHGRRLRTIENAVVTHFVYDGNNPILLLNEDGSVRTRRMYTRSLDKWLADEHAGQTRWALHDHVGTVRDLVTDNGDSLAHFVWTAFGELHSIVGSAPDALGFTGREQAGTSGLVYFRARFYSPAAGRFMSEDPQRPFGYSYAENSPLLFADPSGETAAITYGLIICGVLSALSAAKGYALHIHALWKNNAAELSKALGGEPVEPYGEVPPPLSKWFFLPCGLGEIPDALGL